MEKPTLTAATFLLLLCVVAACDDAQGSETNASSDIGGADTDSLDAVYRDLGQAFDAERRTLQAPAASMAIIHNGEVVYSAGFGTLDLAGTTPADARTLYRIGSVTKMLTAVAVLGLVEDEQLELDAPMTLYLPGFAFSLDATWAPSIHVWNLLTHTSGICDYLTIQSPAGYESDSGLSDFLLGPFGETAYLMSPAGVMYNYSNPNYSLAGLIAETVAAQGYRDLMAARVFAPLHMDRTFFLPEEAVVDGNVATGRNLAYLDMEGLGEPIAPDAYDNPWARPAGYVFSSVLDLAQFVLFLRDGDPEVLGDALREEMMSPQVATRELGDLVSYGYGLGVQQGIGLASGFYDVTVITHSGAIPGFSAELTFAPRLDVGLVTLASTDGAYFSGTLAKVLDALGDLPQPSEAPDLSVDPATYPQLAGEYFDPYNLGTVTVAAVDDTLQVTIPALTTAGMDYTPELSPLAPDSFLLFIDDKPVLATFIRDDQGSPHYLRTRFAVAERTVASAESSFRTNIHRLRAAIAVASRQPLLPAPHPALARLLP